VTFVGKISPKTQLSVKNVTQNITLSNGAAH